jgi:hypothetical protein
MVDTDKCRHSGNQDTLLHRFIVCGQGALIWRWTASKIARILSTVAKNITQDWLLRPRCEIQPPTRKRAVLWILAQLVIFRLDEYHKTSLLEYINYVRQKKIALYALPKCSNLVANYLSVVEEAP